MDMCVVGSENTSTGYGSVAASSVCETKQGAYGSQFITQERSGINDRSEGFKLSETELETEDENGSGAEAEIVLEAESVTKWKWLLLPGMDTLVSSYQNDSLPAIHLTSAYNRSTGYNYGNFSENFKGGAFSPPQWMELQHQELILEYIKSNIPNTASVLNTLLNTLNSAASSDTLILNAVPNTLNSAGSSASSDTLILNTISNTLDSAGSSASSDTLMLNARPNTLNSAGSTASSGKAVTWNFNNIEEWLVMLTSLVLEGLSSLFEQLDYPLLGVVMAIAGLFACTVEIVLKARTERVTIEWKGSLPLFYRHRPNYKPFGSTILYFGLVAAIWQCFHSSLGHYCARKNLENPIKMTITMFLFCICLLFSRIIKQCSIVPGSHRDDP